MKGDTIVLLVIVALVAFLAFGIGHDSQVYKVKHQYVEDCDKLGGFVTEIQTGFVQKTLQCSVKPATSTPAL